MYDENSLIPISALQHFIFCPRQCSLIHTECIWTENYLTATGKVLHEHVHSQHTETRKDIHTATSLHLRSLQHGLIGIADMVEFHLSQVISDMTERPIGVKLKGLHGYWIPYPIEYKRGSPKIHRADEIQLCAQALCLEEMLGIQIPEGALFYGKERRRSRVQFDQTLRELTAETCQKVHALLQEEITPPAIYSEHCKSCSLEEECMPQKTEAKNNCSSWLNLSIEERLS